MIENEDEKTNEFGEEHADEGAQEFLDGIREALTGGSVGPDLIDTTPAPTQIIHGSALEKMRQLVEESIKPNLIRVTDPVSDTDALAYIDRNGVHAIPASVFDDYLEAPRFRRGTANLTDLSSFIAHVERFKDGNSAIFACDERDRPSLTAVLDYHPPEEARHGRHRSHFAFPLSDEWQAWTRANGAKMDMVDFAAFLEDRIIDVLHLIPGEDNLSEDLQKFINTLGGDTLIASPQKLIELSRGMKVNENSKVRQAHNLSTGEGQVLFETDHTDEHGAPLRVPSMFLIAIPVFNNGPFYRVAARLRYRATGGLKFWFELWRADRVFDHAFTEAVERVKVETGLPVFLGAPEA